MGLLVGLCSIEAALGPQQGEKRRSPTDLITKTAARDCTNRGFEISQTRSDPDFIAHQRCDPGQVSELL